MHGSFLEIATGIFPQEFDRYVSRECLSIVRVATEIKINTCICNFLEFFWLMVNKYNWFILVQLLGKLGRGFSFLFYFFYQGSVFTADYVETVVDQDGFIFQKLNIAVF